MSLKTQGLALALTALAPTAAAQITTYTQDFESMNAADSSALDSDGWLVFGNVFEFGTGNYLYGYGPFPAPNHGLAFSQVAGVSGGAAQGAQYLNAYNDYNNINEHNNGNNVEANVFQEWTIGSSNVGDTWTFDFDYLKNPTPFNGDGATTTLAFIKVLEQSTGSFALLDFQTLDTTNASDMTWASGSLSTTILPAWDGELIQIGFSSTATNFDDSGRFYDNISFDAPGGNPPGMSDYMQDFEGAALGDPFALSGDGWNIFANVFDPMGGYLYGYGVFPAPNGTGGFSNIATGNGGAAQGTYQMEVISDYLNTAEHTAGNPIEALVFQEQPIGPQDDGTSWTFSFDYLQNPANTPNPTSTIAFVKVIKVSDASFATLLETTVDTTNASTTTWASGSIPFTVDPSYVGEVVQFGFANRCTNNDDSSRLYDNINWTSGGGDIGTPYCLVNANSTGMEASLIATGSDVAADNNFTLVTSNVPAFQFGFYVVSDMQGFVPNVGNNGSGNLCLGGQIGRFIFPGQIINSGANGVLTLQIDLTQIARPSSVVAAMAGDTWNFQGWFRDTNTNGPSSNFSNGLEVLFQ